MLSNDTAVVGWAGVRVQVLVRRFVGWSNKNLPFLNVPRTKRWLLTSIVHLNDWTLNWRTQQWCCVQQADEQSLLSQDAGRHVSRINKLIWNRHWAARDRRSLNKLLSITDNPSQPLGYTLQRQQSSYKTVPQLTWLCPSGPNMLQKHLYQTFLQLFLSSTVFSLFINNIC